MAITLTKAAAKHVSEKLKEKTKKKRIGIKLAVKTTGCSGLGYKVEYVYAMDKDDELFKSRGVNIFIDTSSLVFLNGTEIDFEKDGLNEGLVFNNPNVKSSCGCGESFNV